MRFGVLCEMVATFAGEDDAELRAATYLKGWIDSGMLAGCRVESDGLARAPSQTDLVAGPAPGTRRPSGP